KNIMYTTNKQKGILSNYVREPKLYQAKSFTKAQHSRYDFQGSSGIFDVTYTVLVTWKDT
ncbi:MAG: hypothetical protein ACK4WG_00390, partial [Aphanizomenon sp.]